MQDGADVTTTAVPPGSNGSSGVVTSARRQEADGQPLAAIRILMAANRDTPDPRIEEELVRLRHEAFATVDRHPPKPFPPIVAEPAGERLPELSPSELTPASLRAGLARHGCVVVRELIPNDRAEKLAGGIDRALSAFDAGAEGAAGSETSPWYRAFTPQPGNYRIGGRRNWMRTSGSMWTVDSPRMLFEVLDLFDEIGIGQLLTDHFGERPALSANKCNLRRVRPDTDTNWHQDGAFLGADVRSVNVWLGLSHCGIDAPGLDIVPRRFDDLVESGTEGAIFDWSVSPRVVEQIDSPVLRPEFAPGDALLFDHLFLHRTGLDPGMTQERHAIETWFFAPSSYPDGQIPIIY